MTFLWLKMLAKTKDFSTIPLSQEAPILSFMPVCLSRALNTSASERSVCLTANLGNSQIYKKKALKILARQVANQFELRRIMNRLTDAKVKEATMAMVVTYNHEINNPLATLKCLTQISQDRLPQKTYKILHQSIDRISDVVKSIESTLRDVGVEFENYTGEIKMMKIKGKDTTKGTVKSKAKKTAKVD